MPNLIKPIEHNNITLNLNLFETGLINLFLLFGILAYSSNQFVKPFLKNRITTINKSIEKVEEQVKEAHERLASIQKQIKEINVTIIKIQKEAIIKKKNLLQFEAIQVKKKLTIYLEEASSSLNLLEKKLALDLKQQMINQLLHNSIHLTKMAFKDEKFSKESADNIINKLQGHL